MTGVLEFVSIVILTSIASLIGVIIAHFTKDETKKYFKSIKIASIIMLIVLAVVLILRCANCFTSFICLIIGIIMIFLADFIFIKKLGEFSTDSWIFLAFALGAVFAFERWTGFLFAAFLLLHNMIHGGLLMTFSRKDEHKHRIIEQAIYIIIAVSAYMVLNMFSMQIKSAFMFAIAGVIFYLSFKKAKQVKNI